MMFSCNFSSFEYNIISFGLTNAPAAFQSFMNDIFPDVRDDFVVVYLDDILIYSEDPAKHDHLRLVLECLIQHGLAVRPKKCSFDLTEIDFLGHIISVDGICMDPTKVAAVKEWTYLKDKKSLQMFLGFANFYQHFIRTFSDLTFLLTCLLLKDADGSLHPVAYYSRQLLPAEINYNVGDKELLAIVEGFNYVDTMPFPSLPPLPLWSSPITRS
jgi:hypothetical protein